MRPNVRPGSGERRRAAPGGGAPASRGGQPNPGARRPGARRRGQRPGPVSRRAPRGHPGLQASPPRRGRRPLHGGRRVHSHLTAAAAAAHVPVAAADGRYGGALPQRQLRRHGAGCRRRRQRRRRAPSEQLPRWFPEPSEHGQR